MGALQFAAFRDGWYVQWKVGIENTKLEQMKFFVSSILVPSALKNNISVKKIMKI